MKSHLVFVWLALLGCSSGDLPPIEGNGQNQPGDDDSSAGGEETDGSGGGPSHPSSSSGSSASSGGGEGGGASTGATSSSATSGPTSTAASGSGGGSALCMGSNPPADPNCYWEPVCPNADIDDIASQLGNWVTATLSMSDRR